MVRGISHDCWICPGCGSTLPSHPWIRYNEGGDGVKGRSEGGFGVLYEAIAERDGEWRGGLLLKRCKTKVELYNRWMADSEFQPRIKGISFEADVLDYLAKSGYGGAPGLLARGIASRGDGRAWSGPWYLMTKAEGERLDKWMQRMRGNQSDPEVEFVFSPETHGRLLVCLAEALAKLHALGVAHRDFKPENVFWDEASGRITIIDFGSASMKGARNPGDGEVAPVSPDWAPPEQFNSPLGDNDARADIFSFGMVFCCVVLGRKNLDRSLPLTDYLGPVADRVGREVARLIFGRLLSANRDTRTGALEALLQTLSKKGWPTS